MALDGQAERRDEVQQAAIANGNGVAPPPSRPAGQPTAATAYAERRLRLNPNTEHKPHDYSDVRGEYAPAVYSALERHLPPSLLEADRDVKLHFMGDILARYWPQGERNKVRLLIPPSRLSCLSTLLIAGSKAQRIQAEDTAALQVFYPEVGGGTLDSHHAFVVEYGKDRDVELGVVLCANLGEAGKEAGDPAGRHRRCGEVAAAARAEAA
ncbi:hypothetical protein PR202_gb29410 [Eleusine coracana subsp. coracana]|uniref:PKHD-type hydroxylase n=1 Tax=Eleusine coracana subsp. coracana TaxID=191504 RepID=A0AAV5FYX2_ELECO|nr:hypothetical protein PR202_gb29410 [Eleusine coracana subsp. coracana]